MKNLFAIGNFKLNKIFFLEAHDEKATGGKQARKQQPSLSLCLLQDYAPVSLLSTKWPQPHQ